VSEGARSRANPDPLELWRQWYETSFGMWANLLGGNKETYTDPHALYRRWAEATTETWRRAAETGTRMARLAFPRWAEMAGELQKQMLNEGSLPADPMELYTRWYNAVSGPISKLADDILRDEAFLESSKRLFDYYAIYDSLFRRASEEYFSSLQLSTSSDTHRIAELVVALDDKVDGIEEVLEEFEQGYEELATAEAVNALEKRLDRVERRLDQLDRVESKLDQLLETQNATADGDQ
jgi:hypothetical protein